MIRSWPLKLTRGEILGRVGIMGLCSNFPLDSLALLTRECGSGGDIAREFLIYIYILESDFFFFFNFKK